MRLLSILAAAGLPGLAFAQDAATAVQKAAQEPPSVALTAADAGLPANPDAPKTVALTGSKAQEARASDFDEDKIAGNEPLTPDDDAFSGPLALRTKLPGTVPDGVTEADFGQPADGDAEKTFDLVVSHAEGRPTIYDEDKIDGNEPPPAPLTERQKSVSYGPQDTGDAEQGVPAAPVDPKIADLAVSSADRVETLYDEDKIDGNDFAGDYGDEYVEGPLAERQKYPSELALGADPSTFGQPATDAPKEADLAVSKADIGVPNIEDNDKIAGNPYVAPPLLPKQKLASVLPDPVADPDMGQPAVDAPKVDLVVSKDADDRPTVEDNDKIDGNPVVNPPLTEREKAPAYEPAIVGLSDDELGLPLAPDAAKTADLAVGKAAEAVTTEYDEDKIAGNSYQDPALDPEYDYESYEPEPDAALVAQIRALLDDPATRTATLDAVNAAAAAPTSVAQAFQSFMGILYDSAAVRDDVATEIARVFTDMGMAPDNPAAVGRMAAVYLAAFGEDEAWFGTRLRSPDEQRTYLTNLLRVAETLPPAQCAPYLDGSMEPGQQRNLLLTAIADWTEEDRNTVFIHRAAAILAHLGADGSAATMPEADAQAARTKLGEAAMAAIDATENSTDLLAAFGDPLLATPEQNCTVQTLILQAALAKTGVDGDLAVRYLVEFGWQK